MSYRIGQLILTPSSKNNTISEVFVSQPDADKETLAGKIFILLEIETKRSDGLKLANFLINYINNSYYQNEKLILKEKIPSLRIEHIFESVVAKTNKKILEFIKDENIKISTNSLNSTIGLIYNNEIHFSTAGKNRALLIYKKIQNNSKTYRTVDLNKSNDENEDISKNKLFTNVISGTIPEGSSFIFSNEALPEYLSPKQLSDITITLPPISAVEQIKNTLSQINEYISFIGIIIKSSKLTSEEVIQSQNETIKIQDSINKLNETEESTENILSTSGNIKIKTSFLNLFSNISTFILRKNKSETLFLKANSKLNSRALRFYLLKTFIFLKSTSIYVLNFIFYIFKTISNGEKIRSIFSAFNTFLYNIFSFTKNNSQAFKKRYKIIILIFIISILGLSYEINKAKKEKIAAENKIQYEITKDTIQQKENQAEANLLYNNDDGAKDLIIEIKELLLNFPQETPEQKEAYNTFSEKLDSQIDKIRKVVKIHEDSQVVNFSDANKNAKINNIIFSSENIYASDSDQNSIYIYNLSSKITTVIADLNNKLENIKYPIASDENTLYWYADDSIIKLDTATEEIFNLDIKKTPDSDIVAMGTYNQRSYMIDRKSSQILRYEKGDTGFLKSSLWLNKKIDLSQAISLDIDGNIFVLNKNGSIHKFLKGNEEEFIQDSIEPPLESANKIVVSKENGFIYILDSDNSRIVVFENNGKFIKQFESKNTGNIKDFILDENNKILYTLIDKKIYSINLN